MENGSINQSENFNLNSENINVEVDDTNKKRKKKKNPFIIVILIVLIGVGILVTTKVMSSNKTYTIKYDSDGGAVIKEQKAKKNELITEPSIPTKDGYVFEYWTYNGKKYDFSSKVTSDIILKAKWKKVEEGKYVVTFDSDGGSKVASQIIEKGKKIEKPKNPSKEGFEFEYWMENEKEYKFDVEISTNITLKAKWKKVEENKKASNGETNSNSSSKPSNNNTSSNNSNKNIEYETCDITFIFKTPEGATTVPQQVLHIKCPKDDSGQCTGNVLQRPSEIPRMSGYEFVDWTDDFKRGTLCSSSKELTIQSIWRHIPVTPYINAEYVKEITYNDQKYDVYKLYNSNSVDRFMEWYITGTGEDGLGAGYEKYYVKRYYSSTFSPIGEFDLNYQTTINNRNYFEIDNNQNQVHIAILKNGYNHTISIIAREKGYCDENRVTSSSRYVCDRGIKDTSRGDLYKYVIYSEWSNKIDLTY